MLPCVPQQGIVITTDSLEGDPINTAPVHLSEKSQTEDLTHSAVSVPCSHAPLLQCSQPARQSERQTPLHTNWLNQHCFHVISTTTTKNLCDDIELV